MTAFTLLIITAGAFLGGFVNGLAGFGTALVALGIWLHAIPPESAATLVLICSVTGQSQTIRHVWHAIDLRRLWPMLAAGIAGVPVGQHLLASLDPAVLRPCIGGLLMVFSGTMLFGRTRLVFHGGGRVADAIVGFGGGVLGGLAGLSGVLPTMWATLRSWGKDQRRGVFQIFNLTILGWALLVHTANGMLTRDVGWLLLWALPGTLLGTWLGARAYRRLSDYRFNQVVLGFLTVSGLTLIWPVVFGR